MDAANAKTLAEKSGNGFQCKVANYFREKNWAVLLSPYYVDAATDKTRESDLIVEKSFPVRQYHVGAPLQSVRLRLFIECKYILEGAVFWMDPMDSGQAESLVVTRTPFVRNHQRTREHHYFQSNEPVAKLFASEKGKGEESDPIYRALNQCLSGFIHNETHASLVASLPNEDTTRIDYPVTVCSDFTRFYWTSVASPADPAPIKRHFLLEVDYAYVNARKGVAREYVLVDMVDFSNIDTFVSGLEIEMAAATFMRERH
jgi:hypothetical protein